MLKAVLILNALSCAIFGALFFLKSEEVANFIGTPPALFVQVLGAGLFINAILLIFTGLQSSPKRKRCPVLFTRRCGLGSIHCHSPNWKYLDYKQ